MEVSNAQEIENLIRSVIGKNNSVDALYDKLSELWELCDDYENSVLSVTIMNASIDTCRGDSTKLANLLTLLDTCVLNCGQSFRSALFKSTFLLDSKSYFLVKSDQDPITVQYSGIVQNWYDAFGQTNDFPHLVKLYTDLIKAGVPFPMQNIDHLKLHFVSNGRELIYCNDQTRTLDHLLADVQQAETNFSILQHLLSESEQNEFTSDPTELQCFLFNLYDTNVAIFYRLSVLVNEIVSNPPLSAAFVQHIDVMNRLVDLLSTAEDTLSAARARNVHVKPNSSAISTPTLKRIPLSVEDVYAAQEEIRDYSSGYRPDPLLRQNRSLMEMGVGNENSNDTRPISKRLMDRWRLAKRERERKSNRFLANACINRESVIIVDDL